MQHSVDLQTNHGRMRGTLENGIHAFRGIPYGTSASGAARFRRAGPVAPWGGVLDCLRPGPICPQHAGTGLFDPRLIALLQGGFEIPSIEPDENCLTLNVWTPRICDGGRRPVMVWCHSGRFAEGSGANDWCNGAALAQQGDVVVVTLNHRLNLFGYLNPHAVAEESPIDGFNIGMLDIIDALRWIRDHIEQFGGNPSNVTLFGSSGGGSKISTLMAMPAARGLFHKAIVQSATLRGATCTIERQQAATLALLAQLGLQPSHVDALRSVAAGRLTRAGHAVEVHMARPVDMGIFVPTVDGTTLPEQPFAEAAPAISDEIPMMIGSNSDETTLLLDPSTHSVEFPDLSRTLQRWAALEPRTADQLVACYRDMAPAATPYQLLVALTTDYALGSSMIIQAELKSRQRAPVYMYRFQWPVPAHDGFYGATHGAEVPFVFGNVARAPGFNARPEQYQRLEQRMVAAWTAFARTGNPNHADLPQWTPYSIHNRETLCFGPVSHSGTHAVNPNDCAVQRDLNAAGRVAMRAIDSHRCHAG